MNLPMIRKYRRIIVLCVVQVVLVWRRYHEQLLHDAGWFMLSYTGYSIVRKSYPCRIFLPEVSICCAGHYHKFTLPTQVIESAKY